MSADPGKRERKEKLKEFFNILSIPIMLAMVNSAFLKMALAAFTGKPKGDGSLVNISLVNVNAGAKHFGIDFGFAFGIMCLLAYIWGRPAYLYIRNPEEKLKEKIRRRLGNIYRDAFLMILIAQGLALAIPAAAGKLSWTECAAAAAAFLAQASLLVAYIDAHLSKQKKLMEGLYSQEDCTGSSPVFRCRSISGYPLLSSVSRYCLSGLFISRSLTGCRGTLSPGSLFLCCSFQAWCC